MQKLFVGDVQGCGEELATLFERSQQQFGDEFELWVVGDLINRGPHNLKALELVRELWQANRARYVLGNHEIAFLAAAFELRAPGEADTIVDILQSSDCNDWVQWLRRCPLVCSGTLGQRPFAMLHAASHPSWSLETLCNHAKEIEAQLSAQEESKAIELLAATTTNNPIRNQLDRITRCRSVTRRGDWSKEEPDGVDTFPWHSLWSEEKHKHALVYGHWAMQGLHMTPGLRGLDTGCVHHGRGHKGALTAWLPNLKQVDPFQLPDKNFWQIPAKQAYWRERRTKLGLPE